MAKKLQLRRGTTTQHNSFTGDVGECTVDTDKDTIVVHDNSTQGGFPLAREDLSNVSITNGRILGNNAGSDGAPVELTAAQVRTMLNVEDDADANVATNLSVTTTTTSNTIASSTGTNATLNQATGSAAGLMSTADHEKLDNIAANANNYSHPDHSGDVTSNGDGSTTIAEDAVTYAKMQNVTATDRILGRSSAGAGIVQEITCTSAGRALLDDADAAAQRTTLGVSGTGTVNTFTRTQSVTPDNASSDAAIDMSLSNFIEVGSTNPTSSPTNLVVGTSGVFYADTAAPTSWHSTFKHPGGAYTAPTTFPAMAPWYIAETDEILVGSWTQGIA